MHSPKVRFSSRKARAYFFPLVIARIFAKEEIFHSHYWTVLLLSNLTGCNAKKEVSSCFNLEVNPYFHLIIGGFQDAGGDAGRCVKKNS